MPETNPIVPPRLFPDDDIQHRLKPRNTHYGTSNAGKQNLTVKVAVLSANSTRFRCLRLASRPSLTAGENEVTGNHTLYYHEIKSNIYLKYLIYIIYYVVRSFQSDWRIRETHTITPFIGQTTFDTEYPPATDESR